MKGKVGKRIVRWAIFLSVFLGLFWLCNRVLVLKREDGITSIQNYYAQEKNTVDVLFLGTSHAGTNIDLETLWDEYGISAYSLWGSKQPFWNSYYFLLEALKSQHPNVVILDVYSVTYGEEYSDEARQVTNTAGMKFNWNRWKAAQVTAPKEKWVYLMLGLPHYHTRYRELDKEDFHHFPWTKGLSNKKGGSVRYGSYWVIDTNYQPTKGMEPLLPKEESYLRKIIDTCENQNIPLILVLTPTEHEEGAQQKINAVQQIAKERNVPFFDMNVMEELGIETQDYSIDNSHLNTYGARKVAHFFGNLLKRDYDIEDHRGDIHYQSWDNYARESNHTFLSMITEWHDYQNEIKRNGYQSIVFKGNEEEISYRYESLKDMDDILIDMLDHEVHLQGDEEVEVFIDGTWITNHHPGEWMVITYDEDVQEVIDIAVFGFEGEFLFRIE